MKLQQNFRENFELAIDTVRVHKLRSFLAVLGVMIGVMLIILVVGLVEGFRTTIQDEITSSGVNTAWAWRFTQGPTNGRTTERGTAAQATHVGGWRSRRAALSGGEGHDHCHLQLGKAAQRPLSK